MIELLVYFVCTFSDCKNASLMVTPEAVAIAACESGDTVTLGSYSQYARSATSDGGIWQFNDNTYMWINGYTHAELDTPKNQHDTFVYLWDNGLGWRHWLQSKKCWDKWLVIDANNKAVMR